ncbi:MAG: hypothetical protein SV487_01730 [Thermodesulfobacteriota bacterium]|nr:hypothetical protein [Thermodesulfobacteriota bacterium]
MTRARLDLTDLETYRRSCLEIAQEHLGGFRSLDEIAGAEDGLNAYPNLDRLSEPQEVRILDEETLDPAGLDRARDAVLKGGVFWEHTAAGEATRLKLGTKFLINPVKDLSVETMAARLGEELDKEVAPAGIRDLLDAGPDSLLPLSLGARHMLQHAFDLGRLAGDAGLDPAEVLARQKMLLILNEKTADTILAQTRTAAFFGFARSNFLFMVQPSFSGINLRDGRFFFDPESPLRLHNHGQLVMQETMDNQIFRLDESGQRVYLDSNEFAAILGETLDKVSFNIEDLDYLTGSIDWPSLALALSLGAAGYNMVMEIVANNPEKPIKGGLAAFDQVLGRNVMIESFQLKGVANKDIKFLNKNFNHYTGPRVSWQALKDQGLPMPIAIKGGYLYFQPVQGDINFLVKTAFVQRKVLKPIRAWKSAANTPEAVNAMWAQDNQPGFKEFAAKIQGR